MHACRHVHAPAGTTLVLLRLVMLTEMAEEKLASVKGVNAVENSVLACKIPQHAMPQSFSHLLGDFCMAMHPTHRRFWQSALQCRPCARSFLGTLAWWCKVQQDEMAFAGQGTAKAAVGKPGVRSSWMPMPVYQAECLLV